MGLVQLHKKWLVTAAAFTKLVKFGLYEYRLAAAAYGGGSQL